MPSWGLLFCGQVVPFCPIRNQKNQGTEEQRSNIKSSCHCYLSYKLVVLRCEGPPPPNPIPSPTILPSYQSNNLPRTKTQDPLFHKLDMQKCCRVNWINCVGDWQPVSLERRTLLFRLFSSGSFSARGLCN